MVAGEPAGRERTDTMSALAGIAWKYKTACSR